MEGFPKFDDAHTEIRDKTYRNEDIGFEGLLLLGEAGLTKSSAKARKKGISIKVYNSAMMIKKFQPRRIMECGNRT